jgi:hypothetical protein
VIKPWQKAVYDRFPGLVDIEVDRDNYQTNARLKASRGAGETTQAQLERTHAKSLTEIIGILKDQVIKPNAT